MFKYVLKIILLGLALTIGSVISVEACDLTLESTGQIRFEDYSSVARETQPQKIVLRLRNDGEEACTGYMSVNAVDGEGHLIGLMGDRMSYGLFSGRESSQTLFQSGVQTQNQIPLRIPAEISRSVEMYVVVDRLQNLPAGTYMADLNLNIHSQSLDLLESKVIRIGANIRPSLQANFTGIGSLVTSNKSSGSNSSSHRAVLDMGELTPNETHRLGLQIRANSPVTIQVSSEYSGALQHEHQVGEIPYGVRFNQQNLDLSSTSILNGHASPKQNGHTNPLVITLSDFEDKKVPAGKYMDVLTFRISAR